MYLITFFDRTTKKINDSSATKIIKAKSSNTGTVTMMGGIYDLKSIAKIEPIIEEKKYLPYKIEKNKVKKETIERITKELSQKYNWNC